MAKLIVWIEDDAHIIWPVVEPLEESGYEIEAIESMREAIDRIEDLSQSDLIILDVILPAQDEEWALKNHIGVHLLRMLRENNVSTPVIALTVVGRPEVIKELRELGAIDVLRKPINPIELKNKVQSIIG